MGRGRAGHPGRAQSSRAGRVSAGADRRRRVRVFRGLDRSGAYARSVGTIRVSKGRDMEFSHFVQLIAIGLQARIPMHMTGFPGVGKTEFTKSLEAGFA